MIWQHKNNSWIPIFLSNKRKHTITNRYTKLKKHLATIKQQWVDLDAEIVDGRVLVLRPTAYMVEHTGERPVGFLGVFDGYDEHLTQSTQPSLFDSSE